ncbi:hexosaminidase [Pseudoxanthomonas sp. GM95]|uniref:family 20 glycosylhydrolase n=1 Tax=Pseudoxanthomonas sp. GM95 TaxID=1881043 RepID=UPI0008D7E84C|nr:family 20 glycosylhydrolase [Pseudoxanthomonas sp. GM95]SEM38021.1 hexosaminidase [Pseudoxanthomonas sp. GM95]
MSVSAGVKCSLSWCSAVLLGLALAACSRVPEPAPGPVQVGRDAAEAQAPLSLIPAPVQVTRRAGTLRIGAGTVISIPVNDADTLQAATQLAALVQRTRGLVLPVRAEAEATPGSVRLQPDPQAPVEQAEGYALDVSAQGLEVRARDAAGVYYGAMTAWQLMTPDAARGEVQVPIVQIRDWPRFGWRGQHLDVARHFLDVDTVKHVLDAMALHKLNVFHWHLSDDQGWRIEIKQYPKLTEIGAWRTPPGAGTHGVPQRVGGFYTQDEIRDIVAYAAERHITVLPEIDMPGHARAAVAAYPDEVGVDGVRTEVGTNWGVDPYLFDTSPRSLQFIRNVLDEVLALFPSTYIHIGGDEAIKDQWEASPTIRAQMKQLGVKDAHAMQGWFNEQLAQYLTAKGRRLIGWDEILEGGLPANASVMSWRGIEGAVSAAQKGHDVVLAPAGWMYLNYPQTARADEPAGPYDALPLSRVYELDPVPAALTAEQGKHVLGVQGALWTEYVTSPWHVDHALFPRLAAVAEVAWSSMQARGWDGFLARLPAQLQRYRALGIDASDTAFAADITLDGGRNAVLDGQPGKVVLGNQLKAGQIHYTTDGSAPTFASPRYSAPFAITLPVTVSAAVFADDGLPLAATRTQRFDDATLRRYGTHDLRKCPDGGLGLRTPLLPDMTAADTPLFDVDLFHACWIVPAAHLDGIAGLRVEASRLARNYGLAHDQSKVVGYPAKTAHGELEVHLDQCSGPLLARVPLPAGDTLGEQFELQASMTPRSGTHDLCLRYTAPITGPLPAVGAVHLIPAATPSPAGAH